MAIDVNALRKFQELWTPVINAIPAVLDAAAQQADLDRALAQKRIELEKAGAEIQEAYDAADKRLVAVNEQLTVIENHKKAVLEEIGVAKQESIAAAKNLEKKAHDRLAAVEAKVKTAESVLATLDAQVTAKLAALQAEFDAKRETLDSEIKDLEKRKAAAEKALDTLRAKLG